MFAEIHRAQAADFLTAKQGKNNCAFRFRSSAQTARQLQHGRGSGRVIVSAVVDVVDVHRIADSEMVEMRREQYPAVPQGWITPAQHSDGVPGIALFRRAGRYKEQR